MSGAGPTSNSTEIESVAVTAGGIEFRALAWGPADGPLALCLHGYPDTARTWRHLGPFLAERGWRVVAPYMRGYAPTGLAPDACYQIGALERDIAELHRALGGNENAVLIGHDWGASAGYAAAAWRPGLFRRVVGIAVPPGPVLLSPYRSVGGFVSDLPLVLRQLRLSWYMFFQLIPGVSERSLDRLLPRLWRDWSPGYDAREDLDEVRSALAGPGRATAALRYYRALFLPWMRSAQYAEEQSHLLDLPGVPLLYLHGERDGCMLPALGRRTAEFLGAGSELEMVAGAGHFLHLERPETVNERIARFLT
jgi:pimeloyl-ACP methyl ester carboxylesterase